MRTDEITIQFLTSRRHQHGPVQGAVPEKLAVAVGEVAVLPGAPIVKPRLDATVTLACGSGPTLQIGASAGDHHAPRHTP